MMNISPVLKLIVAVFFIATIPAQVQALTPDQVFDKVKDAIVVVKTFDSKSRLKGLGGGVLISPGKIATNYHVVKGGASYKVYRGKQIVDATLYAEDQDKDICILDAKGITGKPAQLGKATSLKVGVPVYAVGAPKGLELSLSDGIIAQLRGGPPPFIQTTAAVSPGSSGGGLFDGEGRLVGLITLYIEGGQNLNFAMPVEWIDEIKPGRKPIAEGRSQTEWLKHAAALEQLKDWKEMLDWCRKWTKSEPEKAVAWYSLGFAYGNLKRYDDAIEAFRQALRINPEYASAWDNLGVTYGKLERYNDAIEADRQAIRINPEPAPGTTSGPFTSTSTAMTTPSKPTARSCTLIQSMPRPGATSGSLTGNSTATTMPSRPTARPCVSIRSLDSQKKSQTGSFSWTWVLLSKKERRSTFLQVL